MLVRFSIIIENNGGIIMAKKYDLTGQQIGKLKVIRLLSIDERPTKNHGNYWLCQCDCGNMCKIPTAYLTGNGNYT